MTWDNGGVDVILELDRVSAQDASLCASSSLAEFGEKSYIHGRKILSAHKFQLPSFYIN